MIPEKLTINGIYSYQKEVVINFTNLTSAGIFGIFGSVGSGKSTILEAISYALYGETERLNNRDSKLYNMMNLRSNEMEIDFEFRHQGEKYRFTAFARRNSKNFEDISKSDRKAYHWKSGQWVPLESADATYVTGLKYDHFKQIVIIPQGKFNEFVQLSPADRTKMLRELFPLDRFDLRDSVSKLFSATKDSITSLEGRLQELEEYKPERIEQFQIEILERKNTLEKLKDSLQEKDKERSRALEMKELVEEFHKTKEQLQQLQNKKEHYKSLNLQVAKYEKTRLSYAHLLSRVKELDDEILQVRSNQKEILSQKEDLLKQNVQHEKTHSQIKDAIGDDEQHRKQISALEKTIKIKRVEFELKSLDQIIKDLTTKKETEAHKIKSLSEKNQIKKKQLIDLKKELPNEGELYKLRASYTEEDNLKQRLKAATSELQKVEKLIGELTEERIEILNVVYDKLNTDKPATEMKVNEAVELISESLKTVNQKLTDSELLKEKLSVKFHLATHAKELKEGEKCPLCGSIEHPEPYTDDKATAERELLQKEIIKLQKLKDLLSQSLVQFDNLKKRFKQEGSEVNERKQQVEELQKSLNNCLIQQKEIPLKLTRQELTDTVQNLEIQKKSIASLEQEIQQTDQTLDNQNSIEIINEQIDENKTLWNQLNGQKVAMLEEIDTKWLALTEGEIDQKLDEINKSLQAFRIAGEELTKIEKQLDRIKIESEQNEKFQNDLAKKLADLKNHIDSQLKEDNFESIDEVSNILSEQFNVEEVKSELDAFNKELHLVENKVTELKAKGGDQSFDEEKLKELQQVYESLKTQISSNEEQLGALQSQLDELNKKLAIKQNLQKELTELEKRKRNLDVLNRMFRGDGFVKWVSQIYLKQLCSIANERFKKLTHNQLELDVDDKYNFIVRDYLHEGKTRLLKTLSGGQTFQAALSLAMALSEQIQQYQKVKQQFFFMDEGFGSLDKESLSLVFDTLKQLRKEERTVGIISHVEELQTEIDHAILVSNDPEKGSVISLNI